MSEGSRGLPFVISYCCGREKMKFRGLLLGIVVVALLTSIASASVTVTLNPTVRGWYESAGDNNAEPTANYLTGSYGLEHRSFFVFNLNGLTGITSATLKLYQPSTGYYSPNGFAQTLFLYNVTTPATQLIAGTNSTAIFNDLGSGTSYGNRDYTPADNNTFTTLVLNAAGLNDANAAGGGYFSVGGALPINANTGFIFGDSQISLSDTQLIVTGSQTPEPASAGIVLGALSLTMLRRRR